MNGYTRICPGTYGRERDGSVWIDLPALAFATRQTPTKGLARLIIAQLREAAIEGLIVVRVGGFHNRPADDFEAL